jgi:cell division protein YceG involved in septum cleavage
MTRPMRRALLVFLLTTALGGGVLVGVLNKVVRYPDTRTGSARGTVEVEIPKGAGARQVSELLAAAGLLENPSYFRLYAGQRGVASRFKAGHYRDRSAGHAAQIGRADDSRRG